MLRKQFITGLFVLTPLFITAWVVLFIVEKLDNLVPDFFLTVLGRKIPGLGIVVFLAVTIFTGIIARFFFFRRLLALNEKILSKVPVAGVVYNSTKQMLNALSLDDATAFRRVVLVEYPRQALYSIAFVTGEPPKSVSNAVGKKMLTVFVPTTPNPTSGFLFMVEEKDALELQMTVADALSWVVSVGMVKQKKEVLV